MLEGPRATAAGKSVFFMKCKAMEKIKLLSVDAIKAITTHDGEGGAARIRGRSGIER